MKENLRGHKIDMNQTTHICQGLEISNKHPADDVPDNVFNGGSSHKY